MPERLIKFGLTFTSSTYGSFFYLIIGTHGLHAIAAICGMFFVYLKLRAGKMEGPDLWTAQAFWYFVVGVWPILYWQVYL